METDRTQYSLGLDQSSILSQVQDAGQSVTAGSDTSEQSLRTVVAQVQEAASTGNVSCGFLTLSYDTTISNDP